MTEEHHSPNNNNEEEQNFAELMASYDKEPMSELNVGDKINAKVIAIEEKTVFVDTGTKVDGAVDRTSLLDKEGNLTVKLDDELELYVIAVTESEIELSASVPSAASISMLKEAFQNKIPVEGKVQQTIKGGFHIVVAQKRAFCPISWMDTRYVEDPEIYVGETFQFLIKQFEGNGKNIVVSRKDILEKEEKAARKAFIDQMKVDSVWQGRVVRLMPYGAFVELCPGLEGMVHISELSWARVETAEEAVKIGDTVSVKVIQIGKKEKKDQLKIALSIKQAQDDPWNTVSGHFKAGDRVQGKVTRIVDFGAFVEIAPGIEGLVHISEMSYVKRVSKPQEIVKAGEGVYVLIKDVDPVSRRISLSIRDVDGDPWQNVDEKYTVGQAIKGTFRKREKFGLFVEIEPGVIGLLPKSKIGKASNPSVFDKLKDGEMINVIVDEINSETRRMTLNITEAKEEGDWKSYTKPTNSGMGTLGEMLQKALKQKKTT